jgi:hypothetical protein
METEGIYVVEGCNRSERTQYVIWVSKRTENQLQVKRKRSESILTSQAAKINLLFLAQKLLCRNLHSEIANLKNSKLAKLARR